MGIEELLLDLTEKKGEAKGIKKATLEVIRNSWKEGLPISAIGRIVNLPEDRVRQILDKLKLK